MLPAVSTLGPSSTAGKTLLVVYHTLTGGSLQMAQAAVRGAAQAPGLAVRLLPAREAGADDLLAAQAYLFVTPENLASMAGVMKDFFDRTYYPVLERLNGRPYGLMVCAGSDGQGAARQLARIATGWRLNLVAPALVVCTQAQTAQAILAPKVIAQDELARCEELGQALGQGLAMGIF